jgi:hypothetical protein
MLRGHAKIFSFSDIAAGYGLEQSRGRNPSSNSVKNFHFSILSIPTLGAFSPGVMRQGREADHSL